MHKVIRNSAPKKLEEYNEKFLNEFNNKYDKKDWEKFPYSIKKEVVQSLNEMYNGLCAYCEGYVSDVSSPRIDHFKPKALFPELTFEYRNMNYSCEKCNGFKKEKWDELYFSPSEENPEKHIEFKGILAKSKDERGKAMIELVQLNHGDRDEIKHSIFNSMYRSVSVTEAYIDMVDYSNESAVKMLKKKLEEVIEAYDDFSSNKSQYCTMVRHNFKTRVDRFREELEKII